MSLLLLAFAGGCVDDCSSPATVDRTGRPSPAIPAVERTPEASTKAMPAWAREEDAGRGSWRIDGHEAVLGKLYRMSEPEQKALIAGSPGLWLCLVVLLTPESNAEGLVPFSNPDILLKATLGKRAFVGIGIDDKMAATIAIPWVSANRGDRLGFEVFDRDFVSDDDLVAKLEGKLDMLPVSLESKKATVTCRGVPEPLWAAKEEELYDDFERARAIADASKRRPGAIEEGYPMLQTREMKGVLRLMAELGGYQHPYVAAGDRALTATLARLAREFPAPPATSAR